MAWRIGSLIFGSLAILGMYALVRAAGGDRWPAVGAAALMACDNLLLIHGRIATLDIYALAPMIWGVALYLRGRWIGAAVVLALADCMKEIAPYALVVLALVELVRALIAARIAAPPEQWHWWPALVRWAACSLLSIGLFIAGLGLMGLIAHPYADAEGRFITGGPIDALRHIIRLRRAADRVQADRDRLLPMAVAVGRQADRLPPRHLADARVRSAGITPDVSFIGEMSPPIMLLALPAVLFFAVRVDTAAGLGAVRRWLALDPDTIRARTRRSCKIVRSSVSPGSPRPGFRTSSIS